MSGQLRARAGPREALCDSYTWRQTCARGAAAQRAGARRARKAAAPGGTPLQVCEEPSVPTTLKGALPRARAVAAQALVTKLLHAWALLHLRFHLVCLGSSLCEHFVRKLVRKLRRASPAQVVKVEVKSRYSAPQSVKVTLEEAVTSHARFLGLTPTLSRQPTSPSHDHLSDR